MIARGYLNDDGIALVCTPSFLDIQIGDEQRTAICLNVEARPPHM
ncbi:MAG TPA: stage V sporulation protein S [Roseiflexaceae bacterium]|nr:stage V sporulation protein S [Roseiflexaceae bacterium]